MACRESESGIKKIFLWLGLFWFASCHCASLTKLKALDSSRYNLTLNRGQAEEHELHYGRLLVGQYSLQSTLHGRTKDYKNFHDVDTDYQADMGWGQTKQYEGPGNGFAQPKPEDAAVQELLKMEPKVECTKDSMRLQIRDADSSPGSLIFVDRGSRLSPLPLSNLPASCGYNIKSTQTDLILDAPYDGCFVALEENCYVLPLRCFGLPVKMSCPLMSQSSSNPPMVTCHAEGMVVKMDWTVSVAAIKVNFNGNLEPLMKASPKCGFSIVQHPEGVVISVSFAPCLEEKNGMYTLELHGEGQTKISCPSPAKPGLIETPAKSPAQPTPTQSKLAYPPTPGAPAVPQVPGVPHYPVVDKRPSQGPNQPQIPYFPVYPNFPYPYPENAKTPPTTPPPAPSVTKNGYGSKQSPPPARFPLHPGGQMPFLPSQFYNYPFYTEPSTVPPVKPDPKPLPSASPNGKTTKDNRWQPFYFPHYPPLMFSTPVTPVTIPPSSKTEEKPINPKLPKEPEEPNAGQDQKQFQSPNFPWPLAPYPLYPGRPSPGEPVQMKPPVFEGSKGQMSQGFHPFWSLRPAPHMPIQNPQGQTKQTLKPPETLPVYPGSRDPPQPEVPRDQVNQPDHGNQQSVKPVQPVQPEVLTPQPTTKPLVPKKLEAPKGQIYPPWYPNPHNRKPEPEPFYPLYLNPFHPNPFYPWSKPDNLPTQTPTTLPKPAATELPKGLQEPSYPQIPGDGTNDGNAPTKKPTQNGQPPAIRPSEGQGRQPFNPFYYPYYFQQPQPVTLAPAASTEQPQVTTSISRQNPKVSVTPQSSKQTVPQKPQLGPSHTSPLYCPEFCPSGLSNCCPQINFHQHVHHFVAGGSGSKDAPLVYPGLPFIPSVPLFSTDSVPKKETEATTTSPPKPIETLPSKNENQQYLQPPEGNPATLPRYTPSKPTNSHQPLFSYFAPNSPSSNWLYPSLDKELQALMQRQLPSHYGVPSKIPITGNEPVNLIAQYQPYVQTSEMQNGQPSSVDMKTPTGLFMPFFNPNPQQWYLANGQNKGTAVDMQPNKVKFNGPVAQSELNPRSPVSYSMLQDAGAPTHDKPEDPNNSSKPEAFLRSSKLSARHEQNQKAYFGPKKLVLLPHGPPRKEPHIFSEPQLPATVPQGKVQYPKWLGKEMTNPLLNNGNYVSRPLGRSGFPLLFSASDGAHFMQLSQSSPVSTEPLKPKFVESSWASQGHNQRDGLHDPKKTFLQYGSAADGHANGLKQPIKREVRRQK